MLFSTPPFLFLFLPVLLLTYHLSPRPARNLVLTAASLLFYAQGEKSFLPIMLLSIVVNYWVALGLDALRDTRWARPLLTLGIASDLGLLLVFKYANWGVGGINALLGAVHQPLVHLAPIALPLGISFFTFHKISYKVDVYRHDAAVRRNLLDLALYILLFPQLIAGPIIRYHEIADQIVRRAVTHAGFADGVRRFILGLAKKMILANTAAACADPIFAIPGAQLPPEVAWLGVLSYTLQLYFDFSGYSDMAIGLGLMFGFRFPENFDHPYVASSITEFWRRWHMSLSRWFRDYLYIPLGGNRLGPVRTYFNLVVVFALCGLWHGASWNFLVWGLYHGLFLVAERLFPRRALFRWPAPLRHAYALLVVMGGWVLFRAETLPAAGAFMAALAGLQQGNRNEFHLSLYLDSWKLVCLSAGLVFCLPVRAWVTERLLAVQSRLPRAQGLLLEAASAFGGAAGLATLFAVSVLLLSADTYSPFIYFRF